MTFTWGLVKESFREKVKAIAYTGKMEKILLVLALIVCISALGVAGFLGYVMIDTQNFIEDPMLFGAGVITWFVICAACLIMWLAIPDIPDIPDDEIYFELKEEPANTNVIELDDLIENEDKWKRAM